mmetsp:Transcript_31841/g.38530  ORF Transcript_31841/g.38530 Transcript_31841/m.38530 type:complete len:192 (+) Transcript_31841:154-729(+)|eukprot:CAMPEP_0197849018 /NCGR_PEP_ID=MMETSP1438-20131217/10598_1 /TAXON_ID=1461541 /ORGANISM="Pterosperma sp., Strain CCMP1384" /LENGTH=191 /DNA_ID=CAMNT_0043461513 /DNA_START=140 /DNA_END=715 /DNA_ORIENTATION=+
MAFSTRLSRCLGLVLVVLFFCSTSYTALAQEEPQDEARGASELSGIDGKKDYYKIFGLSKGAAPKEIKKAYRRLSMEYHPDKNDSEEAKRMFENIAEAYEVLSDPSRRAYYDSMGFDEMIDKAKKIEKSLLDPTRVMGDRSPTEDFKMANTRWWNQRDKYNNRMKERAEEEELRAAGILEADIPKRDKIEF